MAYGTVNADVIQSSVANTSLGAGNASTMKNRIINGAMVIDQRNAGAATANTINGYTLDRWAISQSTTGKLIAQQNAGSVTPPAGFTKYLGVTSQSAYSVGAGDYYWIQQTIEGYNIADLNWGTSSGSPVTLSFWVRSSLTGSFGGSFRNDSGTQQITFSYTISSANTWEYKTINITAPTVGSSWATGNTFGLQIVWGLGIGSTYGSGTAGTWSSNTSYVPTGSVSVVGTNGATFYITGCQLEVGSSATGFEYRQYGQELALCQRYYNTSILFVPVGSSTMPLSTMFPVEMRAAPTVAGGGTGFSGTFNTRAIQFATQTTQASQTLTFSSEL